MPSFLNLLRCVGKAVVKHGTQALVKLVPFGDALIEIAKDVHEEYRTKHSVSDASLRAELEGLAQASPAEVRRVAEEVASLEAASQPEICPALVSYLTQMQDNTRRSLRRRDDLSGKTVPHQLSLKTPTDLLPFLPAGPPHFKPGDKPLGEVVDWELVELLGVGGFGEVWLARLPNFPDKQAALKFCLDPRARELLKYEAKIIYQVMHQGEQVGVVELQHPYLKADPPCLQYKFIAGGDLASAVFAHQAAHGELTPKEATSIVLQLAKAIGKFHKLPEPIVHCDLKPANVLVRKNKTADQTVPIITDSDFLITDFGIGGVAAKQASEQLQRGTSSTPHSRACKEHTQLCTPRPSRRSGRKTSRPTRATMSTPSASSGINS